MKIRILSNTHSAASRTANHDCSVLCNLTSDCRTLFCSYGAGLSWFPQLSAKVGTSRKKVGMMYISLAMACCAVDINHCHFLHATWICFERLGLIVTILQIEVHPRYQCTKLRTFCDERELAVIAYASLGCGDLLKNDVVLKMARSHGKTAAQVGRLLLCCPYSTTQMPYNHATKVTVEVPNSLRSGIVR